MQAVRTVSKRRFSITEQSDPVDLISWLLNTLHSTLKKQSSATGKKISKVIAKTFRGKMNVYSRRLPPTDEQKARGVKVSEDPDYYKETKQTISFWHLALDLPPPPLFQDEVDANIVPQVPLFELLNKYDGVTEQQYKTYKENFMKRFEILELPPFLMTCIKRFTKNNFFVEKNPTIVNFPVKNVVMRDYIAGLESEDSSEWR